MCRLKYSELEDCFNLHLEWERENQKPYSCLVGWLPDDLLGSFPVSWKTTLIYAAAAYRKGTEKLTNIRDADFVLFDAFFIFMREVEQKQLHSAQLFTV